MSLPLSELVLQLQDSLDRQMRLTVLARQQLAALEIRLADLRKGADIIDRLIPDDLTDK